MTDGHITRCPHCDTAFRVTDAQLEAARGAVRCGACLLVFSAREHLILPKSEDELEPVWPEDAAPHDPAGADEQFRAEQETSVIDDFANVSPIAMPFGSLVRRPEPPGGEAAASSHEPVDLSDLNDDIESCEPDVTLELPNDEVDAGDADDEGDDFADGPVETVPRTDGPGLPDEADDDLSRDASTDLEAPADDASMSALAGHEMPGDEPSGDPSSFSIDDEAVDIAETQPASRPAWRWWGLAALLLVTLAVQFLWFERERLSLDPRYRDAYLEVCRFLPCGLPEYEAPDALGISGLIIRSHPTRAGALRADALLKNDAAWRQSFPSLRLQFSNLQNAPVAARIFRPDEYLAGEMAGLRFIPARTEVRVTIEIMDPGPDAVNYSLEIL